MDYYYTISLALLPIILAVIYISKKTSKQNLPPGPKPWPIIGHIHLLGNKPHQSVAELSKIYGPMMTLKLGSTTTIVISSPEVAKEMFVKHDLALSSRAYPDAATILNHHKVSMVWQPVGPKWRELKKIVTIQLFTNQKLDASQGLRKEKVNELVNYVGECCNKGLAVNIGKAAFTTSLNLLSNTFFSMDLSSHDSLYSQEFKDLVWRLLELGAQPNLSDFFPLVKPLDLQGIKKITLNYFKQMVATFEEIIDQRLKDPASDIKGDVLATLLKLVQENELDLDDVKHLLMDMFIAGTDTTSSTVEWAMTELLRHPQKMQKAQMEIDQVLSKDGLVHESDIARLPYIQAVVKETLRIHPPAPFLVPHKAENDVLLCGYQVPKNSQIWVNVWSMGRSPNVWPDPNLFEPERFLDKKIDIKGQDFELIPFGSGRRICPGMPLAYRMMHLVLATLIHSFNWKLDNGMNPEDVSVEEKFGITLQKVEPLLAIPLPR